MVALEWVLRGCLLRGLLSKFEWSKALWIHLVIASVFLGPLFWQQGNHMESMGLIRYWLLETILLVYWALFFLKTGSLLVTGLFHGLHQFVRGVIINDVEGPFETLYFHSSASDDFYWLMIAVAFLTVSTQVWVNQRWGMAELEGRGCRE